MVAHELTLGIRNLLLVQLMLIITSPGHTLLVRQELLKIWKCITAPALFKKNKKQNSFWEIDMTKFEP